MKKYITVFIPTYNGERYLDETIRSVLEQELPKGYTLEFLITDSGSSDRTLDIITRYQKKIVLTQIPNNDFGHGKTRQDAAMRARGEFILFLSQDATPTDRRWIINMIEPFFLSEKVAISFGRQIPRTTAVPTIKREVSSVFNALGAPDSLIIHRFKSLVDNTQTNDLNAFFSDVNSAVRKAIVTKIPFRDVSYAEDQALAHDVQSTGGYLKAYAVKGAVWHSNEYSISEFRKRKYDEYVGLIDTVGYHISNPVKKLLFGWVRPTLADWRFTFKDREYSFKRKLYSLAVAPLYNLAANWGAFNAAAYQHSGLGDAKYSLERSNKNRV
jgi:rhamnosyltransferase